MFSGCRSAASVTALKVRDDRRRINELGIAETFMFSGCRSAATFTAVALRNFRIGVTHSLRFANPRRAILQLLVCTRIPALPSGRLRDLVSIRLSHFPVSVTLISTSNFPVMFPHLD
jgi:hypothetical protein